MLCIALDVIFSPMLHVDLYHTKCYIKLDFTLHLMVYDNRCHVTPDVCHIKPDICHITPDVCHITPDLCHITPVVIYTACYIMLTVKLHKMLCCTRVTFHLLLQ